MTDMADTYKTIADLIEIKNETEDKADRSLLTAMIRDLARSCGFPYPNWPETQGED